MKKMIWGEEVEVADPPDPLAAAKAADALVASEAAKVADEARLQTERDLATASAERRLRGESEKREDALRLETERIRAEAARFAPTPTAQPIVNETNPHAYADDQEGWLRWEIQRANRDGQAALVREVLAPVAQQIGARLETATKRANSYHESLFANDEYLPLVKDEFDRELATLPPEQRNDPEVKREKLEIIKGRNIKKIVAQEIAKAANHNEVSTVARPLAGGALDKGKPVLTDSQHRIAARYGMSDLEYARELETTGVAVAYSGVN